MLQDGLYFGTIWTLYNVLSALHGIAVAWHCLQIVPLVMDWQVLGLPFKSARALQSPKIKQANFSRFCRA